MKHARIILLAIATILFVACNENAPSTPGGTGNKIKPSFTFTTDGLTARFTNTSPSQFTKFVWDFGDGTTSSEKSPTHNYNNAGKYTVTMNTSYDGTAYSVYEYVTVTAPTTPTDYSKVYLTGFRINSIYALVSQFYVRITFEGHGIMGTTYPQIETGSGAEKMTKSQFPYTFMLYPQTLIGEYPDPFDWYKDFTVSVYYAANISAEGAQVLNATIAAKDLAGKSKYTVTDPNNGTQIEIWFSYE